MIIVFKIKLASTVVHFPPYNAQRSFLSIKSLILAAENLWETLHGDEPTTLYLLCRYYMVDFDAKMHYIAVTIRQLQPLKRLPSWGTARLAIEGMY